MKGSFTTLTQLVAFIVILRVSGRVYYPGPVRNPPEITILSLMEVDEYEWKTRSEFEVEGIRVNDSTYVIPGDIIGLVLSCDASYPVEWEVEANEYTDVNLMSLSINAQARREVEDINQPSSFKYSMRLVLIGESNLFSGKCICKMTGEQFSDGLSSSVYLFWEGNSPPYLTAAGKNITISSNAKDAILLPCQVSLPDINVYLQQEVNIMKPGNSSNETQLTYQDIDFTKTENGVSFDPTYGFLVYISNVSRDGQYRCFTDEMNDLIYINVVPDSVPYAGQQNRGINLIKDNATLHFNTTSQELICCSNSLNPPKIFFLQCNNVVICNIVRGFLTSEILIKFGYMGGFQRGSCTEYPIHGMTGTLRCVGDGIDVTRTIISSFEYHINGTEQRDAYTEWNEITNPEKLLKISIQIVLPSEGFRLLGRPLYKKTARKRAGFHFQDFNNGFDYEINSDLFKTQIYTGQNVSFRCEGSPFYFAEGSRWTVRWKNSTFTTIDQPLESADDARRFFYYVGYSQASQTYVIIDHAMESITCNAPVWNSTAWIKKTFAFNATDPILPTISGPVTESISWTLNDTDKSIQCSAQGDPMPVFIWTRNGKILDGTKDTNIELTLTNGSATLTFKQVDYSIHGDYICTAQNILLDKTEKLFQVYVDEAHPWGVILIVICFSLTLFSLMLILGWRLRMNRSTLQNLRNTSQVNADPDD